MLFVVSGPSGCGKSTLIGRVMGDLGDVRFSVSFTTRRRRVTEVDGREYHFVSKKTFEAMIREGRFLEWAIVHGRHYGTSRSEVDEKAATGDVLLDIDVQGARQVRASGRPASFIFIMPPVFEELRRRLLKRRTEDQASLSKRLADARKEIQAYPEFDFVVINEDLEKAVADLKSIILASRRRPGSRKERIEGGRR
ncbi:guanylate kinase [bacterium]|nr:MAG: guanylate kinase [bacterium]